MADFCSEADLDKHLVEINPRYSKYASPLWTHHIRSPTELANVSVKSLTSCGVNNVAHAENIQVHVQRTEMYASVFLEWLKELEQRKGDLMRSRPIADHTSLLPQHDAKLKDLSEQIDEVIQYIQKALHKPEYLDMHQDVIRLAKVDLDRKIDIAMLPSVKKST